MNGLVIFIVAMISCIQAQPLDAGIQGNFEPIQKQLGELAKTVEKSVQDTSNQARASFNNIADAGRAFIAPISEKERANVPDQFKKRAEEFAKSIQNAGQDMYKQGTTNMKSFEALQKGMADSTGEVLKNFERNVYASAI